jgi:MFS family permease
MTTSKVISRDFILSLLVQFMSSLVLCILIPALPIYLSRFRAREAEIGLLVGVFSIASLILRPIVGRALLRTPERKFMVAGAFLYVFASIAYLLAPPFWPLLTARVLHGIGLGLFSTAIFTLVARITPETHRGQLISYFYLSGNLAFALGPYFGVLLINRFSFVVLFSVCAGLSLGSLYITLKLGKRDVLSPADQPFKVQTLLTRAAIPPAVIAFMLNVIWGTLSAFIPLYALERGISNPGVFFIFLAITLILGRTLGGRLLDIYDRKRVIFPCLITIVLSLVLLIFSTTVPMFILVAVVLGAGWAFVYPSLMIFAIEQAGPAQGPAMGTFTAIADLGAGIGPMIMGTVLQWAGYPVMFSCLAFTGILNFFYFYFVIGKK